MKKLLMIVAILLISSTAWATDSGMRPYASLGGAVSFGNDIDVTEETEFSLDSGYRFNGAVGFKIGGFRGEVEYAHRDADLGDLNISGLEIPEYDIADLDIALGGSGNIDSLMFNAYYDLVSSEYASFYVGAGLGVAWEEATLKNIMGVDTETFDKEFGTSISNSKYEDDGFAFQIMTGVTAKLTKNIFADMEYRHFDAVEFKAHEVGVNVRYLF